jgi:cobaltochelatase CobS
MQKTSFARLADVAMGVLRDNPSARWDVDTLSETVLEKLGIREQWACRNVIRLMYHFGKIDGREHGSLGLANIRVAAPKPDAEAQAVIDNLGSRVRELKKEVERVAAERDRAREDAKTASPAVVEIIMTGPDGRSETVKGVFHEKMPKLIQLAKARKNIFIYGPTGCGKSHVCGQLAEILGMSFAFVSCSAGMSEGHLTGRLLPVGKAGTFEYVVSEFVRAYESGGVFLLDELDAADPNVLLVINAALANGRMAVPARPAKPYAKRHPDFVCVAAANTVGTGADRQYSGRTKLDAATLDRFQIGKVVMDYDPKVEAALCPDDELRARLLRYRRAVRENRLERAVSTRFMKDAYDMKTAAGWSDDEIDGALFSGWRPDEVEKVKGYREKEL